MKIEKTSKTYWNNKKQESVISIVPKVICELLEIEGGNELLWELNITKDGYNLRVVKK